ncbi:unnamed protein product [Ectocarpus sp. 8 AP-2014]
MLAREEEVDVEVRYEDQQKINEFGRLNTRLLEIRDDKSHIKDILDKLDDATTELMTGEGDSVMLMLGDSFMECEEEFATDYCEQQQEKRQSKLDDLVDEEKTILLRQGVLKKELYTRFGSSIQLEA